MSVILVDDEAKQIIHENFRYQRVSKNGKNYRCCNRSCKAGGKLDNAVFQRNANIHANHSEMSKIKIEKLTKINDLKKQIETNHKINISANYVQCYAELATKYPGEVWKPYKNIKSTLYYHSNKTKPAAPTITDDIVINDTYKNLFDKKFLQFDNHNNNNRIMIFISYVGFNILFGSKRWHFDGTFKASPNLFKQIQTIHGIYYNQMLPAAYILLQNKEKETYVEAFTSLKQILLKKKPRGSNVRFRIGFNACYKNSFRPSQDIWMLVPF
ncbi:unnamed protein product [Brachionus calyciflorus]|uniref:FLYWCH-type domain-containing protein n=1 Tax=Brachionus calyciflorus TaxID=104777 RepID=A0A813ZRW6_9BILA|nr:unnamed protein product [Brachionus calyciflorus]